MVFSSGIHTNHHRIVPHNGRELEIALSLVSGVIDRDMPLMAELYNVVVHRPITGGCDDKEGPVSRLPDLLTKCVTFPNKAACFCEFPHAVSCLRRYHHHLCAKFRKHRGASGRNGSGAHDQYLFILQVYKQGKVQSISSTSPGLLTPYLPLCTPRHPHTPAGQASPWSLWWTDLWK